MGFTRYWLGATVPPTEGFSEEFLTRVQRLINAAKNQGVVIKGPMGTDTPIITTQCIALNGDAEKNEDYETLCLSPTSDSDFCKAGRQPYDPVVLALLWLAYNHGYIDEMSSDDGSNDESAHAAKELLRAAGFRVNGK